MATVSKAMADMIIEDDGYYPGDPRVSKVVRYLSHWNTVCFALVWPHEDQLRYEKSPDCHNVVTIWKAD